MRGHLRSLLVPIVGLVALTASLTAPAAAHPAAHPDRADTVFLHGYVYTVDETNPVARAVAVRDGRIVFVGGSADARRYIGRGTRVVDLDGRMLMPGLVDGHTHPGQAGVKLRACSLDYAALTLDEVRTLITACLDATREMEPDGWLDVVNWNLQAAQPPGLIVTRQDLDVLDTARPIIVRSSDGVNAWVNTRALEVAGVDRNTPDPSNGEIVRDAAGDPTGLLKGAGAIELVSSHVPPPTREELTDALRGSLQSLREQGVTSFMDAFATEYPELMNAYSDLRASGELTARVNLAQRLFPADAEDPAAAVRRYDQTRRRYEGGLISLRTVKVYLDGVIEFPAQTAALLRPYLIKENGQWVPGPSRGPLFLEPEAVRSAFASLDRAGWQLHVHAIGDRAVRTALDGFQAARRANGRSENRNTITHLELVHPKDYPRFARLGVIASFQIQWAQRDAFTVDTLRDYIGPRRWHRLYPANSLREHGASLAGGTDWPVDPLNPWRSIEIGVTRTGQGEGTYPGPLGAHERLTLEQTIRMYTLGSAYQLHDDDRTGSLEVGKRADLIVLDRNLFRIPEGDIRNTKVLLTMLNGRIVYDSGQVVTAQP